MNRPSPPQFSRPHVSVGLPGVHAEYPVLDVTGTAEQFDVLVRELTAALASRRALNANTE
jgi:hypothetical protein